MSSHNERNSHLKVGQKPACQQPLGQSPVSLPVPTSASANPESTQQSTNTMTMSPFANSNVWELEQIVEWFRDGSLTKSRAIQSITAQLNFNSSGKKTKEFAALKRYLSTLNSYKRLTAEATSHGACTAGFANKDREVGALQGGWIENSEIHRSQTQVQEEN